MSKSVDLIVSCGTLLTMNDQFDVFSPGGIAVSDGAIVAVGSADEIVQNYTAAEQVDYPDQVLLPGLVNAHTHVPMTLLRGLNDDLRLDVWLGYLMPLEREFVTPEFVQLGTRLACAEMIRSGITTFADMYYFEDAIAETTAEIGMRALLGQTILMFPAPDAVSYDQSLEITRQFIERWNGHELIQPAVSPHAWYTATTDLLEACAKLAQEYDVPVHTHISETGLEVENCRSAHDMTPVQWNKQHGLLNTKLLAAHCVHINRGDMQLFKQAGAGIAHNPTSNLKLSSGIAPVAEMLEVGLNVGIGTDGPASNNDLDMFEEMRLAALLAKVVRQDPTDLPAKEALALATIGGARATHLGDVTGSLEVGKRADFILVSMDGVHNRPHFKANAETVYSRLIYASKSTDVQHVMCNGRWLMRERELQTVDEAIALQEAAVVAAKIDAFVTRRESSAYNKLVVLEAVEREAGYETQIKIPITDPAGILEQLNSGDLDVVKQVRYRQYDHYFVFDSDGNGEGQGDPDSARLRYREDHMVDEKDQIVQSRSRLTLLGNTAIEEYPNCIMLSRSRFMAPASHSLRFYREYFDPQEEIEVVKQRRRWRVNYQDTDIAVNLDRVVEPHIGGYFLELKSRTWSTNDAIHKAGLITQLLRDLNVDPAGAVRVEYLDLATKAHADK